MRCDVVSVAACVGIITDEVMSFGPADGWTLPLFRVLRFKHGCV